MGSLPSCCLWNQLAPHLCSHHTVSSEKLFQQQEAAVPWQPLQSPPLAFAELTESR